MVFGLCPDATAQKEKRGNLPCQTRPRQCQQQQHLPMGAPAVRKRRLQIPTAATALSLSDGIECERIGGVAVWRRSKTKPRKQTQVNWKSHQKARCHLNRTVVIHRVRCFFLSSLLQPHTGQIHLYKRNKKKRTRVSGHEDDAFAADLFLKPTRSKSFKATLSLTDTCPCDLARTTASKEKRGKTTPK